ncbi:SEC-C metal-binding domain-containing protein [Salipaludibacillus daqingensis]|uniref:SEC-C metal-binding domain-containing protein n=1 Tax=Salipaludibacillus daqingensis TaxID=3041001 RepID=UPI0024747F10|nr:SEC-C metal-binding domain-containing protein [Salipaludibacillus daqingensis]
MATLPKDVNDHIDAQMQKGYKLKANGREEEVVDVWLALWEDIKAAMKDQSIPYIEELEELFQGNEMIFNWAQDVEMFFGSAAVKYNQLYQKRLDFLSEFIVRMKKKHSHNALVMKRVIAESYFLIGEEEEGERLFKKYTKMYPTSGFGWINWSDMYFIFAREKNMDKDKAIRILKQGLQIDNVNDRDVFYERLIGIYEECNMIDEKAEAEEKFREETEKQRPSFVQPPPSTKPFIKPAKKTESKPQKVGRNDPCPCGSGKKFKKCCGA